MRLLIVTQVVDVHDPVLGFFHRWIETFAAHVEHVEVIALRVGTYTLPQNVRVHSLGKEHGSVASVMYAVRFLKVLYKLRGAYDHVFVHMNPEYLMLAGWWWRMQRIPTVLWYMHKTVSLRLRLGVLFASYVCTASQRSMRLETPKKRVVGHGIHATLTTLAEPPKAPPYELLTVGRISRIKRVEVLIDALCLLRERGYDVRLTIVGGAPTKDAQEYQEALVAHVEKCGMVDAVTWVGPVAQTALHQYFARTHVFVHASDTGSLDKAALEPLLAGIPLVTTDMELGGVGIEGVAGVLPQGEAYAYAVQQMLDARVWEDESVRTALRSYVLSEHSLEKLIPKIVAIVST